MGIERKIQTLDGGEHIRLRWSMYLDADAQRALQLALREVWVNSCDELTFRNRKGEVRIDWDTKTRTITIQDNGNGIPAESLADAYLKVNTGSNFFERQGNLAGAMGVGLKALSHTAEKVEVTSVHNGIEAILTIIEGEKQGEQKDFKVFTNSMQKKHSGVKTVFIPSEAVYGDAWLDEAEVFAELDEAAKFYPLITFYLNGKKIHYPEGLKLPETEAYYQSESLIVSLGLKAGNIKPYGNRLYLKDGGNFYTHFKTQLTKAINNTIDFKITGGEIQAALSGYVAVFVENPVFSNQQKSAIGNKEVNTEITSAIKDIIEQLQKSKNWQKFIKELEAEVKAEEAAQRAREKIKKARDEISKASKKKILLGEKLKDCVEEGETAWLALSEGDSGQGTLNAARDPQYIATFPLKGKIISTLKHTPDHFLQNEEIQQICQILGCDIFEKYDSKKLRYGRVLIAVDADQDGLQIATLLITFFYTCMPEFLKEGRLYWMKAPLYTNREKDSYIFTEVEWSKVKNRTGYKRSKGLGEYSVEEARKALFGEKKQWVQLKPKNWEKFSRLIEDLMGKDIETRRDYIFQNVNFETIEFL